jgi:hypothetical protein
LVLDVQGNIAVATDPYALAQDAASQLRTNLGECYYNTTLGVPYNQILGKSPSLTLLKSSMESAAKTVGGVAAARCFLSGIVNRRATGQVQVTSDTGLLATTAF